MNNGSKREKLTGLGIGYVSIMIIFAVITLTVFAVLSFSAAGAGESLTEKSAEYTRDYYAADSRAKRTLFELCSTALSADEVFFAESFSEEVSEKLPEVVLSEVIGGVRAEYSEPINERQTLFVSVTFYDDFAQNGERCQINRWQSGTQSDEADDRLNVWDGTF